MRMNLHDEGMADGVDEGLSEGLADGVVEGLAVDMDGAEEGDDDG